MALNQADHEYLPGTEHYCCIFSPGLKLKMWSEQSAAHWLDRDTTATQED